MSVSCTASVFVGATVGAVAVLLCLGGALYVLRRRLAKWDSRRWRRWFDTEPDTDPERSDFLYAEIERLKQELMNLQAGPPSNVIDDQCIPRAQRCDRVQPIQRRLTDWSILQNAFHAHANQYDAVPSGFEVGDFARPDLLFRLLGRGNDVLPPVRLLDGEWLEARAAELTAAASAEERRSFALPRRQELYAQEPDAYMSVERLALLPRGDAKIGSPLPIIVVSHAWRSAEHPDPEGDNLLALVDAFGVQRARSRFPKGGFAVFYDWCSLPQRDANGTRTAAEREAFVHALSKMQVWYAHAQTLVYMLTKTPPAWGDVVPYAERGWPTFEQHITMFNKRQSMKCWANVVDVNDPSARPPPPLTAEAFDQLLASKVFTNDADPSVVSVLYKDTLATAFGLAMNLRYVGMHWSDEEFAQLARVLPHGRQCIRLNFKGAHNQYTARSAKVLAELLRSGAMPKLEVLGAGCTAKDSADPGPLMSDPDLQAACEARGISLQRDAD